jgi:hypothetical protein
MRTMTIGVAGLCLLLVTGCGMKNRAVGPAYAESKPTEMREDAALVYVMRFRAEPVDAAATILVDGAKVLDLSDTGFTWFHLPPGHHEIDARWGQTTGQHPAHIALELQADRTYYVELSGVSRTSGHGAVVASGFEQLTRDRAERKLEACGFQKPGPIGPAP